MVDSGYLLAPPVVNVRFRLAPAFNGIESLRTLIEINRLSGFADWVTQTTTALPAERRDLHQLVFETCASLFYEVLPVMPSDLEFTAYVDAIAAREPYALRDQMLEQYALWPEHEPSLWPEERGPLTGERLLTEPETFRQFMASACMTMPVTPAILARADALYHDPPALQAVIVEHLRWLWVNVLQSEWERVRPMLEESVAAFERLDFTNMTVYEAARAVTTRDLRGIMDRKLEHVDTVVFVPSAHIGPYVSQSRQGMTLYIVFGARLPQGAPTASSALSRTELLTRLNALADDTRLRILELLTREEELCAQDIIERLGLSQSSVSRHLSQLSANGFVVERRREVAKCYSLNTDRVVDTLRTLTGFLARQ